MFGLGCYISGLHTINQRLSPDLSVLTLFLCRLSFLLFLPLCLYLHFPRLSISLCFRFFFCLRPDIQKKQPGEDCTSKPIQSTGSSQSPVFSSETSSSSSQSLSSSPPSSSEQPSAEEPSPTFPSTREGKNEQAVTPTPRKTPLMKNRQSILPRFSHIAQGSII